MVFMFFGVLNGVSISSRFVLNRVSLHSYQSSYFSCSITLMMVGLQGLLVETCFDHPMCYHSNRMLAFSLEAIEATPYLCLCVLLSLGIASQSVGTCCS